MRTQRPGRHELGQNFLVDRTVLDTFVDLTSRTDGPIIEIGAGDGALTLPLQRLGRPLTGIEIDGRRAARLARRTGPETEVVHADFLDFRLPSTPHVLVGNLPFHQTTVMLRRILRAPGWTDAVLLVQWEVARRRAGVGGATMMTAQWWPWFEFRLVSRVPASAFRPRPGVDGGLMTLTRRPRPLVPYPDQRRYQDFVSRVFTGRGNGLARILATGAPELPRREVQRWLRRHRVTPDTLPRSLGAREWAELFELGEKS
ncbi:23S ribosomal RNA methyltransferase Erm [Streptomyces phyllanthi]|uniref:23S ribosomal RNA methyltransferase Erm n=1 Tax=Streptomyces phyllanthi TaxID=1803180 RepID=A0A5N8WE74_9ACTN|nr:23S ribosomal RNA methyltransferase Erm [Streptomyces phyllanthi]MPY45771.1 23S ribosomal RNA methyltransferase Erm [Streptomyces phyllanthi]